MLDLIIPLYNSLTIDSTLASIAYQTDTDINIYLIDDCSDINYDEIVKFYKKYLNIIVLRLNENGGPGVAREYGINNSSSPYIMFIDSDDSLASPTVIEKLRYIINNNKSDLFIGNFIEEIGDRNYLHNHDEIWLHGKVYSRKFLKDNGVHFNETRKNEDNFFNQLCILHRPRVYYFSDVIYIYRNNINSITRINNHEYNYEGSIYYAYNISEAIRIAKEDNCDDYLISFLGYRALLAIYFYYNEFIKKDVSKLIKYASEIYKNIDINSISDGIKNNYLIQFLKYEVDTNPKVLLKCSITFDDYIRMLGDYND